MIIRDLHAGDAAAVVSLNNANTPAVNAKTGEQMTYMLQQARWAIGAFESVAGELDEGGERLLGFLITFLPGADYESMNFAWFGANYERFAYMDRIVVDPGQRSAGIGVALYEALFALIGNSQPFIGIDVNVRPANDGSLRFHRRLGFETVHQHDTDGGAKTVALMIRQLP